jgi:ABC-type multidrug transport system fused ATPase/permease subunit
LAVLLISGIVLELVNPQVLRAFIDAARAGRPVQVLNHTALLFLAVVAVSQVVAIAVTYLSERIGWNATNRLREDLALHCLQLPLAFHHRHTPGELIQRVDGDVDVLSNFFTQFVIRILGNSLLLVGVLVVLLREDWHIGVLMGGFTVSSIPLLLRMKRVAVPAVKAQRQAFADLAGFWEERITGAEDVRASGAVAYTMQRHAELLAVHMRNARISHVMSRVMQSSMELLLALGSAAALVVGAYVLTSGAITLGTLYLVLAYTTIIAWNLLQITMQLDDLQKAIAAAERIFELYHTQNTLAATAHGVIPDGSPSVAFEHVSFGYTDATPILTDISFCLKEGTVLGLLGRTGSGKTTLIRLLFRFYDPQQGVIRLNGVDVRDVPLPSLRRRFGVVTQDVQLFHATVRDNLTLFDTTIPDERIHTALAQLDLDRWMASLPNGLDTVLLGGDSAVSAGEAQLLAFTRVFLQDPDVVILDEASSRLDPATEYLVGRAIGRLLDGRTAIIIAHRLQTVQRVDDILILQDGRIAEFGSRAALAATPASRFSHLLRVGLEEVLP